MDGLLCLRCKTVPLHDLPSPEGIRFLGCPQCLRHYAKKPDRPMTFRWLHPITVALYGVICILAAFSYGFLVRALIAAPGQTSTLAEALGDDFKGRISPVLYGVAIPIAFLLPLAAFGIYVFVAAMWIVPDQRIERRITA